MLYQFFDESKKDIILSYYKSIEPKIEFVEYKLKNSFREFIFKIEYNQFSLTIMKGDFCNLYEMDGAISNSGEYHHFKINYIFENRMPELKEYLLQSIRDYKLKNILPK